MALPSEMTTVTCLAAPTSITGVACLGSQIEIEFPQGL
jgi:hypothetical protein